MIVFLVWEMGWNPTEPLNLIEIYRTRELANMFINSQEFPDKYQIEEFEVKGRLV